MPDVLLDICEIVIAKNIIGINGKTDNIYATIVEPILIDMKEFKIIPHARLEINPKSNIIHEYINIAMNFELYILIRLTGLVKIAFIVPFSCSAVNTSAVTIKTINGKIKVTNTDKTVIGKFDI